MTPLLPRKTTPQEWTDEVLPLFDQPEAKPVRETSRADTAKALEVKYTRYRSPVRVPCHDCFAEHVAAGQAGTIESAAYLRTEAGMGMYLCYRHTAETRDREALNGPG